MLCFTVQNVPEDAVKSESFTIIYIDSWFAYENEYYLQAYLDHFAYKIIDK